jgi:sigma-E factor negative regulatory protein RseC
MGWLVEMGRVVAVEGDAVWVEADRSSACGRCAARAGCGHGAMSALMQSGKGLVRALSGEVLAASDCEIGDQVWIRVPEITLLSGTFFLYGIPLLVATGCALGLASYGDMGTAIAFGVGLISAFAILKLVGHRRGGTLPGFSEPRLAGKASNDSGLEAETLATN